jgi:O-antigen/teichoic acid export membrane protein
MSVAQIIAKNTFWQTMGKILGTFIGLVTVGLLTRYLGQEGFGYYTTALAFMQFFGVLVDMGLYMVCLKEISARPENEKHIFANFFTLRFISAIIFLGAGALLIFLFPYPATVKWSAAIVSVSFLFMSLVQILITVFQKYLKMGQVALAEIGGRIGFLVVVALFVFYKGNLPYLMLGNVANALVYFLILWYLIKKYVKIEWSFDYKYWLKIYHLAWPIALGIAFNLVYFRADTIILSLYKTAKDVGIYGAPYKILEIITTFPHMFMGMVMPLLAAAWLVNDKERFKKIIQKTFDFFLIIIIPMILGSLPLANRVMSLLAGDEFVASGPLLPILMLATGLIFLGITFTYGLVILDKQKAMLKYYFSAAILSLIGYFIFIPKYSYFGAAWVTVFVEAFIALTAWMIYYKTTKLSLSPKLLSKSLLSGVIMLLVLFYLPNMPTLIMILIGFGVYLLGLFLTKAVDKNIISGITKNS